MNSIKTIIAAALSLGYLGAAQAAETVKPLQGISFHTKSTDAVAYFTANKGQCRVVLTVTDASAYAPTRFEEVVKARKSTLYQVDEASALEFTCQAGAQAMTIETIGLLETSAAPIGALGVKRLEVLSAPRSVSQPRRQWYAERYESSHERYGYKDSGYEIPRYKDPGYDSPRNRYGYDDKSTGPHERYGYKDPGYESPRERDDEGKQSRGPRDDDDREVTDERLSSGSRVSLHAF